MLLPISYSLADTIHVVGLGEAVLLSLLLLLVVVLALLHLWWPLVTSI